jgi:hypothetical protein
MDHGLVHSFLHLAKADDVRRKAWDVIHPDEHLVVIGLALDQYSASAFDVCD